ncbi:MAG TPA: hypothetical protein VK484_10880, partial [Ferruginibacter sp.]|nr:hypothetical protein [Ferruginibacter sp.]
GFHLENLDVNTYIDFKQEGAYKQVFYKGFLNFQNSGSNRFTVGGGTSFEYTHLNPRIHSAKEVQGKYTAVKSYVYFKYNSVNQIFYPTKGMKINTELGHVYNQRPNLTAFENGLPVIPSNLNFENYSRAVFDGSVFVFLKPRLTFFSELQAGINFTSQPNVLNNFLIGGINGNFRNQVRFAGLQEAAINSSSVVALQLGLRQTLWNNVYVIGRINGLLKDFATNNNSTSKTSAFSGYALTFAYKTPIGPLELSAMYSDQSKKLQSYVLFGIPF